MLVLLVPRGGGFGASLCMSEYFEAAGALFV